MAPAGLVWVAAAAAWAWEAAASASEVVAAWGWEVASVGPWALQGSAEVGHYGRSLAGLVDKTVAVCEGAKVEPIMVGISANGAPGPRRVARHDIVVVACGQQWGNPPHKWG